MSLEDTYGFLLYHGCVIVPKAAKMQILDSLHLQHTGETKTLMNARQLHYSKGMTNDIKRMVSVCRECIAYQPSQRQEPQIQTIASRPFEAVSVDLGYQNGVQYLIFVDRYSGWPLAIGTTVDETRHQGSDLDPLRLVPGIRKTDQHTLRRRTPVPNGIHPMVQGPGDRPPIILISLPRKQQSCGMQCPGNEALTRKDRIL
jgi:hypothetical protein